MKQFTPTELSIMLGKFMELGRGINCDALADAINKNISIKHATHAKVNEAEIVEFLAGKGHDESYMRGFIDGAFHHAEKLQEDNITTFKTETELNTLTLAEYQEMIEKRAMKPGFIGLDPLYSSGARYSAKTQINPEETEI